MESSARVLRPYFPLTVATPIGAPDEVAPDKSPDAAAVVGDDEFATGLTAMLSGVETVAGAIDAPVPAEVKSGASSSEPAPPQALSMVISATRPVRKTQIGYKFIG